MGTVAAGLLAKNDAPEDRTHFSYFYNSHLSSAGEVRSYNPCGESWLKLKCSDCSSSGQQCTEWTLHKCKQCNLGPKAEVRSYNRCGASWSTKTIISFISITTMEVFSIPMQPITIWGETTRVVTTIPVTTMAVPTVVTPTVVTPTVAMEATTRETTMETPSPKVIIETLLYT